MEYKGSHLSGTDDAGEKRAIGQVWESRSSGTCQFIMLEGDDLEAIRHKIVNGAV